MKTGDEESGKGFYLFWALFGGALVVAMGSTALLGKLAERPDLAGSDPLLMTILKVARSAGWGAAAALGGLLVYQLFKAYFRD